MDASLPPVGAPPKEVDVPPKEVENVGSLPLVNSKRFLLIRIRMRPAFLQVTMKMAWGQDDDQREGRVSAKVD